jgi:cytoskeletal protein RodZ
MKTTNFQSQLGKLRQRKELLVILLFLFVIVIFWIMVGVFSSQQTAGITTEQKSLSTPLSPSLNISVIDKLEQKKSYSDDELADFPVYTIQSSIGGSEVTTGSTEQSQSVVLPEELESTLESIEEEF